MCADASSHSSPRCLKHTHTRTNMHTRNMRVHVGMHRDTCTHVQTHMRSYAHARGCKQPLKHSAAYGTCARTHMHARNVRVHTLIHSDPQTHTHACAYTYELIRTCVWMQAATQAPRCLKHTHTENRENNRSTFRLPRG
jgi:hypothetical protein